MPYVVEAAGEPYQKIEGLLAKSKYLRGLGRVLLAIGDDVGITASYREYCAYLRSPPESDVADGELKDFIGSITESNKEKLDSYRSYSKYIEWMAKILDEKYIVGVFRIYDADDGRREIVDINVIDWLKDNLNDLTSLLKGKDISKVTFQDAYSAYENRTGDVVRERSMHDPIIFTLPNGRTLRRLTKLQQIRDEGNVMRHCCGDESLAYDHYAEENGFDPTKTKDGIYALRSPNGKRLATILIERGKIAQQFGKANTPLDNDTKTQIEEALVGADVLIDILERLRHGKIKKDELKNYDLRGIYLRGADLRGADLRGANLQGALLRGAHLEGARLEGAHLEGARLVLAHLEDAHLEGAFLQKARLTDAHLEGAHLEGAHLEGAILEDAHLEGAFLQKANLEGAYLRGAELEGANLQGAEYDFGTEWPEGFTPPAEAVDTDAVKATASLFDVVARRIEAAYRMVRAEDEDFKIETRADHVRLPRARRVTSKLSGATPSRLNALWDTWDTKTLSDFNSALVVWHKGTGYMHTGDADLSEKTPLDEFAESHPEDWKDYADIVASGAPQIPLYRVVLFDQADDILDRIVHSGNTELLEDLYSELEHQNQLIFSGGYVTNDSIKHFESKITTRRFSSWTSKASVAFKLSFQGGAHQIGEGAVIVRTTSNPRVVHTFDAAIAFEKWCAAHKDKVPGFVPFMAQWNWQVEYVVEASSASDRDVITCDGVVVVSDTQSDYYRVIADAAGYGEDENED